ncbi:hypothetical protein EHI8A_068480 [Entamoeba histolytica HM-1:IMSS-B]|uniref:CRIB domain-containing protein n=5 Tax=Entamoeba histolytica TaxID=5759 RepID=C4M0R3_ENTH1|nr:hypothetical protein EHI_009990 [Entamoeba histolytica HM-1:IMSS]EMH75722.1 hypothetical protein EHI8A_068480 [Entamoeba histolytica HM-1:IMSS-B]EMS17481.1 hypothetical protein KM1_128610 [Entamoeba histolytica HM-3:IMSS]ENY61777.1 hypothetical protein EHI7A_066870 [Entamoeba histolytica HM-1:IMSS-A]GAT94763.1 hypothetical protein CL6EHI_009990 [Entamoeba histolytica]EAL51691.1 hypothetical protein EHI_009990 [Entamoeba histolytica HM-1:IMSS]|eukprot:XP_657077.1 hypothetical protein EHI_009990 [Entamoeba histolytica HM-1:IMSS]
MSKKSHRTEIKPPTTVTRSHIGINPKTGEIEFENLPSTWVAFFKKAGIRKKDLSDKETRDKVFKLMASSHIVNDMQKEVNNNPSTARALRNSVRQQKKIPEGITLTPITPGFIQQQKKKEVDRTLNQCTSGNSSSKKEIKDQPKSITKQNYSKQSQPIQKPVSYETGKKKPEPKQTNTTTPVRGKVTIPKVFCGEEQQEKPLTFYEKMQLKEKEKPKTSNVTNNSTLVKQKQEQKKSDFSTKPTSAHTYSSSYTSHSTQPVSYNTSHNVKETTKSSTVTKKENSLELKTSTTTQHKDDKINHTSSSTRAYQQPQFTKPKITPSQSNTSSKSQVSTSKPIKFEQKQSNDVDMSKVFAEQRGQLKKTGPQRQTPSVTKSSSSTQFAPKSQSYSNPKTTTKTYTSSSTVPKPVHSTNSIQPTTKPSSYKTTYGSVTNSSPRTKLNTNSPFSSQTNEQKKEELKPIIKKEEPKPIIKEEEPKCDITEVHTVPLPPSTVPSFVPPPPPLSEDAYTTEMTSPNSAPTVSFTDLIYAQSNNLKPTEIEERQKEEDEVITALRNILSDRRKDMNMEDNEEDSEDDWSDDW